MATGIRTKRLARPVGGFKDSAVSANAAKKEQLATRSVSNAYKKNVTDNSNMALKLEPKRMAKKLEPKRMAKKLEPRRDYSKTIGSAKESRKDIKAGRDTR